MTPERIKELREDANWLNYPKSAHVFLKLTECLDAIESIQSRVQELEKDKARLDWLRDHHFKFKTVSGSEENYGFIVGRDFRQSIDAAMKGEK